MICIFLRGMWTAYKRIDIIKTLAVKQWRFPISISSPKHFCESCTDTTPLQHETLQVMWWRNKARSLQLFEKKQASTPDRRARAVYGGREPRKLLSLRICSTWGCIIVSHFFITVFQNKQRKKSKKSEKRVKKKWIIYIYSPTLSSLKSTNSIIPWGCPRLLGNCFRKSLVSCEGLLCPHWIYFDD